MPSGDPQAFMEDYLRLLREFLWHAPDKGVDRGVVDRAYRKLEGIYIMDKTDDDAAKQLYKDNFSGPENSSPQLREQLIHFNKNNDDFKKTPPRGLHDGFIEQFESLCDLMEEKDIKKLSETATRQLGETARTNIFP
jgi:hypothetical protein